MLATVALASLAPARDAWAAALRPAVSAGVVAILFAHGLRLSRAAIVAGAGHWRLHLAILAITFAIFPLAVLVARAAWPGALPAALWGGMLFLAAVPSTVQSSIGFTAVARGNVAAAVCAATLSNSLGVFVTPLLAAALLGLGAAALGAGKAAEIVALILLPAVAGHAARPWLGAWAGRRAALLSLGDKGVILLIVYAAFSTAVVGGLWRALPPASLAAVLAMCALLLGLAVAGATLIGRGRSFTRADARALAFVGATKSLATGAPIAGILLPPALVGVTLIPLMLYHALQTLVCAGLAARWASPREP